MQYEFVVSQPFQYSNVSYLSGDVIVGDLYDEINADPHYSSGNFVIRRNAEAPVTKPSTSPSAVTPVIVTQ